MSGITHKVQAAVALFCLAALIAIPLAAQTDTSKASVSITSVPAYDKGGSDKTEVIKGTANGVTDCSDCRVVLYARTNQWWVQPLAKSPFTNINNGSWQSMTSLGTEYAALLVKSSFKPSPTLTKLPTVGGDVLAIDVKPGKRTSAATR